MTNYRQDIDCLKGLSILFIILFHLGWMASGYLGVDVFFVINGFFIVPSVATSIYAKQFSYFNYLKKRFLRLSPLITVSSIISLLLGIVLMLPDHLENLAQSIIAGELMSENILANLTTRNYWDVVNEYKPLMHLWYVGVLFEFYLTLPVVFYLERLLYTKIKREHKPGSLLAVLVVISFMCFLFSKASDGDKFYYLHFRFFELGIGGIVGLRYTRSSLNPRPSKCKTLLWFLIILLFICGVYAFFDGSYDQPFVIGKDATSIKTGLPIPKSIMLILTVFITALFVSTTPKERTGRITSILSFIGKMSYSIFIWHQVVLAFYRYTIGNHLTFWAIPASLLFIIISIFSFLFIEKKQVINNRQLAIWISAAILTMLPSWFIFQKAGVLKDLPELEVKRITAHRGMFGEYCDRINNYQDGFDNSSGKKKVLIVGNSFARDFGNILLESDYKDHIQMSYCSSFNDSRLINRLYDCDYLFVFSSKKDLPEAIWMNLPERVSVWGIGTKNYGECNGPIYTLRYKPDYHLLTTYPSPGYIELNNQWKNQWGDHYIDLMTPVLIDNEKILVFTDEGKYISQDCRHLTPAGARFYARILDLDSVFHDDYPD